MNIRLSLPWLTVALGLAVVVIVTTRGLSPSPLEVGNIQLEATCPPQTVPEHVDVADVIVAGTVFLVVPDGTGTAAIIQPSRWYKGTPTPSLRLAVEPVAAGSAKSGNVATEARLHVSSNQPPYLFFLRQRADGWYTTDACSGTRPFEVGLTPEERTWLGDGQPA